MSNTFVGRQAIYDRNLDVYAYELLFRSGGANHAEVADGEQATTEVLLTAFTDIGLERLVGCRRAFINLPRSFLSLDRALLPPERVVLEILEDVEVDEELLESVAGFSRRGYLIALDDFVGDERWRPLLELVDIVKVDVRGLRLPEVERQVRRLRPFGVRLLAEKVETRAEFDALAAMGFDYFQGYFLARPQVVPGRRLSSNKLAILELLAALHEPSADVERIEELVSHDVALSYKVLRLINSAFFSLPGEITSMQRAVVYLGLETLRRWVSLIVLSRAEDKPAEILRMALTRARMCEHLCERAGHGDASAGFTTGLFSALDVLLDEPLGDLLADLPLAAEIKGALLERRGALGEALDCAFAYERCVWARVHFDGLPAGSVRDVWVEAVEWSSHVSAGLGAETPDESRRRPAAVTGG